ncbi:MAG: hypothetical protein J2P19_00085 [Pseudonocardia sp.]|nr:hypothetical protein [Pseudonocardia sp.]
MTQPRICDALAIPETGEVRECVRPEGHPPPHRDQQGRPWTADTTPLLAKLLRDARKQEP